MKHLRIFLIVTAFACCLAQSAYDVLAIQCDSLARDGKYVETFSKAQEAVRLDPGRFEGYYFTAYALYYRDMLSEARSAAADAASRAPLDRKPEVQKLIDAIEKRGKVQTYVKAAEEAETNGLNGRAAEAFTAGWRIDDTRDDLGLRAAKLWLQVRDFPNAARILDQIHDHPHDGSLAAEANQLLESSKNDFQAEYRQRSAAANQFRSNGALDRFVAEEENCAALDPSSVWPPSVLATFYAQQKNEAKAEEWLLQLAKMGKLTVDFIVTRPAIANNLLPTPEFKAFIRDVLGASAVQAAQDSIEASTRAKRQAADAAEHARQREEAAAQALATIQGLVPKAATVLQDTTVGKGVDQIHTHKSIKYELNSSTSCSLMLTSDEMYRSAYVKGGDEIGSYEEWKIGIINLADQNFGVRKGDDGSVCASVTNYTERLTDEKGQTHEYNRSASQMCFGEQAHGHGVFLSSTLLDQLQDALQKAHDVCSH